MNKRRRRKRKSCKLKSSHNTRKDAMIAINKTVEKNFIFHRMQPYKCKYCGKWHISRTRNIIYNRFKELVT
jgi:hypothetical protein